LLGKRNPLRALLNKIIWDSRFNPEEYEVIYVSRGALGDVEKISADKIIKVWSRGFDAAVSGKTRYIPFHRIVEIKNTKTGEVLFRSRKYSC